MLTRSRQEEAPVILIGGPARCGKSLFAAALADEIGARVVCFDRVREKFLGAPAGRARKIARMAACLEIINDHAARPGGVPLMVEGADLIYRGRGHPSSTLQLLLSLRDYVGCHIFTVGCADRDAAEKADAIVQYASQRKDWVYAQAEGNGSTIAQLAREWADRAVEESRMVREQSAAAGIPHLPLRSARFGEDLTRAVRAAKSHLPAPVGTGP